MEKRLIILLATLSLPGCQKNRTNADFIPASSRSEEALKFAMEAWKSGQGSGREAVGQLLEMTRRFDQLQGQGLFWFLEWIRARRDSLSEVDLAAPSGQTGSVRLMSIHRSKGLEFPIVVLAGLGSQFNLTDLRREVLLDEECGPCLKALEPFSGRSYPTPASWPRWC